MINFKIFNIYGLSILGMIALIFFLTLPQVLAYAPINQKFKIEATIRNGCNFYWIANHSPVLNFGQIITATGDTQVYRTHTEFELNCTPGTDAIININDGEHASHSGERQLLNKQTNDVLPYQLYMDTAATHPWLNNKGYSYNQFPTPVIIYAQLAACKPVPAGYYSDNLTITISY